MAHLDPIIDKIITARVSLLLKAPFFGNLATRLKIEEADGDWCTTAATDGRHIFFDRKFFTPLTVKHIEFVIAHEVLHNVFDHMARRENRHHKLFNVAADYVVNGQLVRDKIGHLIPSINMYHDTAYYGLSAEEIYDKLKDQNDDALDKLGELLDQHIDWENGDGDSNGNKPSYTKEELREIRDEMREATISAAQSCGAGNVPASIARMIRDLTEPKMDWRELLGQQIQSTIRSNYSFARPSRKGWHMNAILPGTMVEDTIDICVAIDMSGSIGDAQAADFLGEIKGIMEEYKDFHIKLWTFDTKVYNEQDFDNYNIDEFDKYEVMGGGGTCFDCNWDYMKEHDIVPKKFIMFTDLGVFGNRYGDPDYCDTIFIAHSTNDVAPFGTTCRYDLT
jgi:predicted metal-dependent peptidase